MRYPLDAATRSATHGGMMAKRFFGFLCYRIFMALPVGLSSRRAWLWLLSWAGYYANESGK